jgi:hypothetical protein
MRWKLLRRRLSVSAPRVIVRSHLPWPLRWLVVGLMLGLSAALALWAFEFGQRIAGVQTGSRTQVKALQESLAAVREQYAATRAIANSAETMLKAERAAQERLAEQVKALERRNAEQAEDLAFFETLMPAAGDQGWAVRGLKAAAEAPGQWRCQLLVMRQDGGGPRGAAAPRLRWELVLTGVQAAHGNKPWTQTEAGVLEGGRPYQRLDRVVAVPAGAVVRQVTAKLYDAAGAVLVTETRRL